MNSRVRVIVNRLCGLGALVAFAGPLIGWSVAWPAEPPAVASPEARPDDASHEARFITHGRQITLDGRRAGEGYFSVDGRQMVFQSERDPANPFFQIYLLDFTSGDVQRISPGQGKTTCAWIHPSGRQVLFASTHEDPEAVAKQEAELSLRREGKQRRYSWDYDEAFELYARDVGQGTLTRLTNARGYDAEGSYSPDGNWIAFSSNRHAYQAPLSASMAERLKTDASYFLELYLMRSDGAADSVRRLTDVPGYDGGPFFSPDGSRICFRHFSEDGATAEIYTMATDGSDVRQLTTLGAMSWAPFYHPSGQYLIFATNRHGFDNFELYIVDAAGQREPQRVTFTPGFDGLPVFHPTASRLAWTSNRTSSSQSQIFLADWNHAAALEALGLTAPADSSAAVATTVPGDHARQEAVRSVQSSAADFSSADLMRHVDYLCRPDLGGRLTGTPGEQQATAYVAACFDQLGLMPAGDNGAWFQPFEFSAGVSLGQRNQMSVNDQPLTVNRDWLPLVFSQEGQVASSEVVFAGYGMVAPAAEGQTEYDSYVHLDVQGKWVVALRFLPESVSAERRQYLLRFSSLRYKAMVARDRGARGLILVTGPNSPTKSELLPLQLDGTLSGSSLPVVCVTRAVAERWFAADKSLKAQQDELDQGEPRMGFALTDVSISAEIDIQQIRQQGRNVLGRLPAGSEPSEQAIVVGAHVDHLGTGPNASSLALEHERDKPHLGADDNASGVAAVLEIAQYLVAQQRAGQLPLKRDVIFAAWSGEELGLLGSTHYVKQLDDQDGDATQGVYPRIAACINLDMVGRFDNKLVLQGVGSSTRWPALVEQRNAVVGLPVVLQTDSYLPTDASAFYLRGVPILSAFTGSHQDYHTPRDTPDKLNYTAAADIARLMALIARGLATDESVLDFQQQKAPEEQGRRANLRAYLGTVPDYTTENIKGLALSGVSSGGPADKAGLRAGDVIVELAGRKIENIYDYTYAIEALKIGEPVKIVVERKEARVELEVVPQARQ